MSASPIHISYTLLKQKYYVYMSFEFHVYMNVVVFGVQWTTEVVNDFENKKLNITK